MEPHFSRISCWIFNRPVPPMPIDAIVYYESSWDIQTNEYIKENQKKINAALSTYPSGYCRFQLFYVPQPKLQTFESEEEAQKELERKAAMYHEATSPFEGVISCALLQDSGHEEYTSQRIMTFNIEDCTPQAILTAIRYMAKLADDFKDEVTERSGSIPAIYRQMWQVDLAVECKEFYETNEKWLSGKYEMFFTEPILKYDEDSHRLWFIDKNGNLEEEFVPHSLQAQAFYILVWNHREGVKDRDLCSAPNDEQAQAREKLLKEELVRYYKILSPNKDTQLLEPHYYEDKVEAFCSPLCNRDSVRSKIKKAFINHETKRVHELYAKKVASYYAFDGKEGIIKVANRNTIILPDCLKETLLHEENTDN
ncbi:hypothetical protein [Prevotella sp. E13-27]|uniref:hypothetical protein n=1 Tax=Prevotella sp. E13-27 TaxID=2938122 RepID=UPI00200ADFD2|nr:hypothetical protein [Prevotella sp. E13-27]MCK8621902.1 hypothetical protein [Prevotella sp. E13-27]